MSKQLILSATVSKRMVVFIQDSTSATGGGLTGLTNSSSGLAWYYWREDTGNLGGQSVTLASATRGTYTSGGFKEIDATNMPGFYELGVPNTVLATGATWATMVLRGVTNMVPVKIELQLVKFDPNDAGRLGLTDLPNGPMMVKKNQALSGFTFPMFNSSSHQMQTGLTVTCVISKDGGSVAASTFGVTEVGSGLYTINFSATETNCNVLTVKFSATGADDLPYTLLTQP